MKYFVIYAFLASIFLAYVGDFKKKFRWTVWALLIGAGIGIFIFEKNHLDENTPITKSELFSSLEEFKVHQDSLYQKVQNKKLDDIASIESANENIIKQFISDNVNLNSIVRNVSIPISVYLVSDIVIENTSTEIVSNQIDVLNEEFNKHGIQFYLTNVIKINDDYFGSTSVDLKDFRANLNFAKLIDNEEKTYKIIVSEYTGLSLSTMPLINSKMDKSEWDFGGNWAVINYNSLPNGSMKSFNGGKSLIRGTAQWLGLYNVFTGACKFDGDFVDDTPMQEQLFGKPNVTKACDTTDFASIHNYMQYVDDEWMNKFTEGQVIRMKAILTLFKNQFVDDEILKSLNYTAIKKDAI